MSEEFQRTIEADLGQISNVADDFSAWAEAQGISSHNIFAVNLVLDELISNVILYGIGEGKPGSIRIDASIEIGANGTQTLALELRDSAPPFDPFSIPPPNLTLDIDERTVGGLGIHFTRTMMDKWSYARESSYNVVRLGKNLAASGLEQKAS